MRKKTTFLLLLIIISNFKSQIIDKSFLLISNLNDIDNTNTLTPIAYGTEYTSNKFITDIVAPCNTSRNIYYVADNAGLRFNAGLGSLYTNYSISVFFKFNPYQGGWARIIDVTNNTVDSGIYRNGNNLNFFPNGNVGSNLLINSSTQYVFLTLTRNGSNGLVKVYINGSLVSTYNDVGGTYKITSPGNILFVKDDISVPREQSPMNLAYIRVTNTLFSDQDVLNNYNSICNIITPPVVFCYKFAATLGTILETKHGITALGRAGTQNSDNWPMVRKGAWAALEAKTKGFVPNRVPFDASGNPVGIVSSNFVEGMMVYDITNNCLKIYDGTAWKCYATQTCPD